MKEEGWSKQVVAHGIVEGASRDFITDCTASHI